MPFRFLRPLYTAVFPVLALAASSVHAAPIAMTTADRQQLSIIQKQVSSDLSNDVMPFWTRHTLDPNGGFNTVVDRYGHPTTNDKYVIMQARMVWALSAADRYGLHHRGYLNLAKRAVHYMTDHMWDQKYGGFYMQVDANNKPVDTRKYLYSQEFVMYAFSEYGRDAHDPYAIQWARRIHDLIQTKMADPVNGGYREDFDRAWQPISESLGVGGTPTGKTVNAHMHLFEAMTALVEATGDPKYKAELGTLVDLVLAKAADPTHGYLIEPFTPDWKPKPDSKGQYTSYYGHELEFAWLILDAMRALGRSPDTVKKQSLGMIDHALAYGWDAQRGGFAGTGSRNVKLTANPTYEGEPQIKDWWEQAESLTALITAYRWTGDRKYLTAFEKEWAWVRDHQIDRQGGDWFVATTWDGSKPTRLDKGMGGWKTAYHNGRALMRVSQQIRALLNNNQGAPMAKP